MHHGPVSLLCPWDSPGKNTGVGGHFLLQQSPGIFSDSCPLSWWCYPTISYIYIHVYAYTQTYIYKGGSQVSLVVKNPPDNARDVRDAGSIPGWGRSPGEGNCHPLQHHAWRMPWTEEPGGLHSPEGRKESDMSEWAHTQKKTGRKEYTPVSTFMHTSVTSTFTEKERSKLGGNSRFRNSSQTLPSSFHTAGCRDEECHSTLWVTVFFPLQIFFLVMAHSKQDLSSPTRSPTYALCKGHA